MNQQDTVLGALALELTNPDTGKKVLVFADKIVTIEAMAGYPGVANGSALRLVGGEMIRVSEEYGVIVGRLKEAAARVSYKAFKARVDCL